VNVKRVLEEIPVDEGAEHRAWAVVRTAYARREPAPVRARRWPLAAVGAAAVVAAAAFSPPGRAVVDAVRRTIGVEHAAPALFRLPAPGRLLVSGAGGTWVVSADGSKRRLGDWTDASWSPHGLFVVAASTDELAAMEPGGRVHWTLARAHVSLPRWGDSRDDTRIAYLSGGVLRVVAGDGTGDRPIGPAARVAPAWKAGTHVLAYATATTVRVVDADSGRLLAAHSARDARALAWSPDGTKLAVATPARVFLYKASFNEEARVRGVRALAFASDGRLTMLRPRTIVEIGPERVGTIATLPGLLRGLGWSPDGRWLVTSLPAANQWVFVGARGLRAVGRITEQFGGSVSLDGWARGA
jgi:WD40 repeat protein